MTQFPCAKGSPSGLSGLLLRVWQLADGQRPVFMIAAALACSVDQVWTALDLLDHVGLLAPCGGLPVPAAAAVQFSAPQG